MLVPAESADLSKELEVALENKRLTSTEENQSNETNETRKLSEIPQTEELKAGSETSAPDRKRSVENEIKTRESISRRASKISLQSSTDDKRSRAQSTHGNDSQKRPAKVKQGENKVKRTASIGGRTKAPISKRT